MPDTLAITQPFTEIKPFTNASLVDLYTAVNAFITGTLDVDPDHIYVVTLTNAYWDPGASQHVAVISYTYVMPYAVS